MGLDGVTAQFVAESLEPLPRVAADAGSKLRFAIKGLAPREEGEVPHRAFDEMRGRAPADFEVVGHHAGKSSVGPFRAGEHDRNLVFSKGFQLLFRRSKKNDAVAPPVLVERHRGHFAVGVVFSDQLPGFVLAHVGDDAFEHLRAVGTPDGVTHGYDPSLFPRRNVRALQGKHWGGL